MSHVFVWSKQDGCECDGLVLVDKGLEGQIVESMVSQAIVSFLIYGGCKWFAYVLSMFLYAVSI